VKNVSGEADESPWYDPYGLLGVCGLDERVRGPTGGCMATMLKRLGDRWHAYEEA